MAKKVIGSLGAILASAMAAGRVGRNVVRDQERHSRRQNRLDKRHERRIEVGVDVPTKDEIRAMLAAAQGRWRPLVVTAIFTGLRASELRGLRWDDGPYRHLKNSRKKPKPTPVRARGTLPLRVMRERENTPDFVHRALTVPFYSQAHAPSDKCNLVRQARIAPRVCPRSGAPARVCGLRDDRPAQGPALG